MSLQHQLNEWSRTHQSKWLVVLRAALGLCLFIKGIQFIQHSTMISEIISGSAIQQFTWLQTIIPWLHLLGGVMIIIGLFTRVATAVQIPILVGAVFFTGKTDLLFTIAILVLLVFFLFEGGGPLSWDRALRREREHGGKYPAA